MVLLLLFLLFLDLLGMILDDCGVEVLLYAPLRQLLPHRVQRSLQCDPPLEAPEAVLGGGAWRGAQVREHEPDLVLDRKVREGLQDVIVVLKDQLVQGELTGQGHFRLLGVVEEVELDVDGKACGVVHCSTEGEEATPLNLLEGVVCEGDGFRLQEGVIH